MSFAGRYRCARCQPVVEVVDQGSGPQVPRCPTCDAWMVPVNEDAYAEGGPAELRGSEVEKDVGIADQHRARLGARIAGNVAGGIVGHIPPAVLRGDAPARARRIAEEASDIAEAIMQRWGL